LDNLQPFYYPSTKLSYITPVFRLLLIHTPALGWPLKRATFIFWLYPRQALKVDQAFVGDEKGHSSSNLDIKESAFKLKV
jgi:hypothetical protein